LAQEVLLLDSCVSTNDVARERLARGQKMDGCLILTQEQTGGRGRSARDWWSGPANLNLAFTLGLRQPDLPAEVFGLLGACALADSCVSVLQQQRHFASSHATATATGARTTANSAGPADTRVALKWPNDLLIDGAKVSGFLCELPADSEQTMLLGLGVNLNAAPPPDITPYPTNSLAQAASTPFIDGTDFLSAWLWRLERQLRRYLLAGPTTFEQRFLSLLRTWAPHGVMEKRGGVSGPLLDFSVARGLSWGDWQQPTVKPMGWISSLEALQSAAD
jgi:biotin-(acetyl-CoA carboxylase) ligase